MQTPVPPPGCRPLSLPLDADPLDADPSPFLDADPLPSLECRPPGCRLPVMWPVMHAGTPTSPPPGWWSCDLWCMLGSQPPSPTPVNRMTGMGKNIILAQTSFAGGNESVISCKWLPIFREIWPAKWGADIIINENESGNIIDWSMECVPKGVPLKIFNRLLYGYSDIIVNILSLLYRTSNGFSQLCIFGVVSTGYNSVSNGKSSVCTSHYTSWHLLYHFCSDIWKMNI